MPREVVVFDTNAYRAIGEHTMAAIHAAERRRGICAQAAESVDFELLALYAHDEDRNVAASTLRALVAHTVVWQFRSMIPFAQSPLRRSFVPRARMAEERQYSLHLSELLVGAFILSNDRHHAALASTSESVREFVNAREHEYGKALFDASARAVDLVRNRFPTMDVREARRESLEVLREFNPPFAAEMLAERALIVDDVPVTQEALSAMTATVLREAPVAVQFAQRQIELAADGEIDPRTPKHSNSLWDMEICALMVPDSHTVSARLYNQSPLVVVTTERQIAQSASAVCARHLMRSLREHCEVIGLGALADEKRWP